MRGRFSLARSADHIIPSGTVFEQLSLLTQLFCFVGKTFFKGLGLFEIVALLHLRGSVPVSRKAGALPGVLITDKSHVPGCDDR
jgi:hypothetical protein